MVIIASKGDKSRLKKFEELGFRYYELYIRTNDFLEEQINSKLKSLSIHFPNSITVDGKIVSTNLADSGIIGEKSEQILRQTIDYAKKIGCGKVVIHTGSSEQDAYKLLAKRLERVNDSEILICIENIPLWNSLKFPLTYDADSLLKLRNKTKIPLGIVLDLDHLYITAAYINKDPEKLVEDFFKKIIPDLIHVCGSDNFNYVPDCRTKISLLGEHIPLKFDGELKNKKVKDRINHDLWAFNLKNKETPIVLEIDDRPEYDYLNELAKSRNLIKLLLKKTI